MTTIVDFRKAREQALVRALESGLDDLQLHAVACGFDEAAHFIDCARQSIADALAGRVRRSKQAK